MHVVHPIALQQGTSFTFLGGLGSFVWAATMQPSCFSMYFPSEVPPRRWYVRVRLRSVDGYLLDVVDGVFMFLCTRYFPSEGSPKRV